MLCGLRQAIRGFWNFTALSGAAGDQRGAAEAMVRRMLAPLKINVVLPQGCLPESAFVEFGRGEGIAGDSEEDGGGERLGRWFDVVEGIFCGMLGQQGKAGLRLRGRRRGPRMVWKCALVALGCPEAFSKGGARSWAKLRGWCRTIRQARSFFREAWRGGHPLGRAAEVCCRPIVGAGRWDWKQGSD